MARFYLGDFVSAENHFARGRAFVEAPDFLQTGGRAVVVVVTTFAHGSFNAWITGHADAARERQEHMRRILEGAQRNPHVTDIAQIAAAYLHAMVREFARAEALAGEALASCEEHGFQTMGARTTLGLARAFGRRRPELRGVGADSRRRRTCVSGAIGPVSERRAQAGHPRRPNRSNNRGRRLNRKGARRLRCVWGVVCGRRDIPPCCREIISAKAAAQIVCGRSGRAPLTISPSLT
jgi:hypothetical protein